MKHAKFHADPISNDGGLGNFQESHSKTHNLLTLFTKKWQQNNSYVQICTIMYNFKTVLPFKEYDMI